MLPGHEFREMKCVKMSPWEFVNDADTWANPSSIKSEFLGMRSRNTYFKQMSPGILIGSGGRDWNKPGFGKHLFSYGWTEIIIDRWENQGQSH